MILRIIHLGYVEGGSMVSMMFKESQREDIKSNLVKNLLEQLQNYEEEDNQTYQVSQQDIDEIADLYQNNEEENNDNEDNTNYRNYWLEQRKGLNIESIKLTNLYNKKNKTASGTKIIKVPKGSLTTKEIKELIAQGYTIEEEDTPELPLSVKPFNTSDIKPLTPKSETIIVYADPNKAIEVVPIKPQVPSKPTTIQQPQPYVPQQNPIPQAPLTTSPKPQESIPNKPEPKTPYQPYSSTNNSNKEQQQNQQIPNGWIDSHNLERSPNGMVASCVIHYYTEEQRQQLEGAAKQELNNMLDRNSFVRQEANRSQDRGMGVTI